MSKIQKLVIFDLDGTLIGPQRTVRTFAVELVSLCLETFEWVAIWTLGNASWARYAVEHLLHRQLGEFFFVWNVEHATVLNHVQSTSGTAVTVKSLRKLWKHIESTCGTSVTSGTSGTEQHAAFGSTSGTISSTIGAHNTVIVDDTPLVCIQNPYNHLYVRPFDHVSKRACDLGLYQVWGSLTELAPMADVRPYIKQHQAVVRMPCATVLFERHADRSERRGASGRQTLDGSVAASPMQARAADALMF
jgi:hypothetical protein